MPQSGYLRLMAKRDAHAVATDLLLNSDDRVAHDRSVCALLARNALLTALETSRTAQGMTKSRLAELAGLDASSVRRLLTSRTANPTTDVTFRLLSAMDVRLEAVLPTGERIKLVGPEPAGERVKLVGREPTVSRHPGARRTSRSA